jgi:hypothetical protein
VRAAHFTLFLGIVASSAAQTSTTAPSSAASPEVSFQFERPGMQVPKYAITVHEDGTGTYHGEEAGVSGGPNMAPSPGRTINRPLRLSSSTTETIFKTARSADYFNIACESKAKNIANTGKKTLTYSGQDGHGSCVYNYSENKSVAQLGDTFQAIAFTMDEGRKLEFLHRFDRLGLYSEMETLIHEVEDKRAIEIGNIAPVLTSIVADEALMQKVRERAAKLLAQTSDSAGSGAAKGH